MKAYCWRGGRIELVKNNVHLPSAFIITRGPAKRLRELICALSRHAYDGKTLLVPGLPEAKDENSAVRAVLSFRKEIESRLVKTTSGKPSQWEAA